MKKIYLTLLGLFAVVLLKASPDIYTPELVAPSNNAENEFPNTELDWMPVTGQLGLYYEVQIDTTDDFNSASTFQTELSSKRMSMLLFGQIYYWRVRAIDQSGSSEWTEVRNFTVISSPVLRRPTDSALNVAPNVQIMWFELLGATHIDFQLDTSANFDSPRMSITSVVNNTTTTNAANLHFGEWYKVRIRARHDLDTSVWSDYMTFRVTDVLTIKKPADNSAGISPDVTFEWNSILGLTKYQIHVSSDPEMTNYDSYNAPKTAVKLQPDTLLFNNQYYWRMAAIHETDTLFSNIMTFFTIDKPALNSPANNTTNVLLQPTLKWQAVTGIVAYQIDIADNAEFNEAITYYVKDDVVNEFKVPANVFDSATNYYWKVRAISSRDTSLFSDSWSFKTITLGIDESIEMRSGVKIYPTPAVNKINIKLKNTFNGIATVEVYDLLGTRKLSSNVMFVGGITKDYQVNDLSNGIYMVSIVFDGKRYTSKLIIQK